MLKIFINWDRTDNFPISKIENDNNNKFVVGKFQVKCQLQCCNLASDMKFFLKKKGAHLPAGEISCQMPDNYMITGI